MNKPEDPEQLIDLGITMEQGPLLDHLGENTTNRPDIDWSWVARCAKQDLRRAIPQRHNLQIVNSGYLMVRTHKSSWLALERNALRECRLALECRMLEPNRSRRAWSCLCCRSRGFVASSRDEALDVGDKKECLRSFEINNSKNKRPVLHEIVFMRKRLYNYVERITTAVSLSLHSHSNLRYLTIASVNVMGSK